MAEPLLPRGLHMIITYEEIVANTIIKLKEDCISKELGENYRDSQALHDLWDFIFTQMTNKNTEITQVLFSKNLKVLAAILKSFS